MPPKNKINKDFFKQVFAGQKALIERDQIRPIAVPHYDELGVVHLIKDVMAVPEYAKFFPEQKGKASFPSREYFYNVLNTVAPEYVKTVIMHATKQRYANDDKKENFDLIEVTDQWKKDLQLLPFYSNKIAVFKYIQNLLGKP